MDDSTNRTAIKRIETRITELSNEDPTNNERVIREFESLRQYLLKQEEEEKEDVDMDEEDDDEEDEDDDEEEEDDDDTDTDEGEDYLDELEKKLENRFVVGVIMDLLTSDEHDEHKSAFTQDLYDNPPDGDPMLLLSTDDLSFIRKLVEKLSDSSYCLWIIISKFCEKAKEWLQWHPHSIGDDDSKITVLRDNFLDIISARDKKLKELNGNLGRPRARALLPDYDNNNNPDTATTDFDDESEPYKEEFKLFSDSEEEKKKCPILERDREEEFSDDQGRQSNSSDGKRLKMFDEEQQGKSSVK